VEGHIRVASGIQEHKIGPFNTTAAVTIKFVLGRYEEVLWHLYIITMKVLQSFETKCEVVNSTFETNIEM
jgi:hypothetical protein